MVFRHPAHLPGVFVCSAACRMDSARHGTAFQAKAKVSPWTRKSDVRKQGAGGPEVPVNVPEKRRCQRARRQAVWLAVVRPVPSIPIYRSQQSMTHWPRTHDPDPCGGALSGHSPGRQPISNCWSVERRRRLQCDFVKCLSDRIFVMSRDEFCNRTRIKLTA